MSNSELTYIILKGWQLWEVEIANNYYNGRYADYSYRAYPVAATSEKEAKQLVLTHADEVLKDLMERRTHTARKLLPKKNAIPITEKRIGSIWPSLDHHHRSTFDFKKFLTPNGFRMLKLNQGNIVDILVE